MLTFDPQSLAAQTYSVEVAGQTLKFTLDPGELGDVLASYDWGVEQGFLDPESGQASGRMAAAALGNFALLRRIEAWEGITDPQGQPVPCTETNKLAFFGRYPAALFALGQQVREREEAEAKNSGASAAG
ncbi:MAG: hypothetical protein M1438_11640 [Deltaproteobacteria bacterium]|nr:hypothetical protein [Deltaproteobacteria bacterium]